MLISGNENSGVSLVNGLVRTYHGDKFRIVMRLSDLRPYLIAYYSGLPIPVRKIKCVVTNDYKRTFKFNADVYKNVNTANLIIADGEAAFGCMTYIELYELRKYL